MKRKVARYSHPDDEGKREGALYLSESLLARNGSNVADGGVEQQKTEEALSKVPGNTSYRSSSK